MFFKKAKPLLIVLLLLALTAGLLYSVVPKNPYQLPAITPNHYLYHITDGQGNGIYLLGSMHYGVKPTRFVGTLQEVYKRCDTLLVEQRWDIQDPQTSDEMFRIHPVSEITDPAFWTLFEELDRNYTSINQNSVRYNTWYLQGVATAEVYKAMGLNYIYGVDSTLQQMALRDDKHIVEIEPIALRNRQMETGVQTPLPLSYLASFSSKEAVCSGTRTDIENYNSGSYEATMLLPETKFMYDETLEIPTALYTGEAEKVQWEAYRKNVMLDRTAFMVQTMQQHMQRHDTLAVIGLEHLFGNSGILALFETSGYSVEKVL